MQIDGEWLLCEDGVVRPIVRGEILAGNGSWVPVEFLVDTGADRTVLSLGSWVQSRLPSLALAADERLAGLGGVADSVVVDTQIRLTHETGGKVRFRGRYAAVTEPEALDMSVLGRDISGLFAVIVDKSHEVVCLLGQRHSYHIVHS